MMLVMKIPDRSLISLLTAMMITHVLLIAAVNLLEIVNMMLLTAKTTMLAPLIPAVLILVVTTVLWFAPLSLAIPCLVTLIMDVIMTLLSVMMTMTVP
jgi:hypothetical protein